MFRTYSELSKLKTFDERFKYLMLCGNVGVETFGYDRYINQLLYNDDRWKKTRRDVILRDNGCDLGINGFDIYGKIIVHHMNPVSLEDIENYIDELFDPEFLISTSMASHNGIHYSDLSAIQCRQPIERRKNDTCPWKR